jgi:hypothetical protein
MSLYRQAGGRPAKMLVALSIAALLVGAVAGFAIGRGSAEEPSLAEAVAELRADLAPVAAGLELVPIEYEGAVRGGEVVARTEYAAAQGAASRAAEDLEASAEDLRAIDPAGYAAANQAIANLQRALDAVTPPIRIEALAQAATARVESLAGSG